MKLVDKEDNVLILLGLPQEGLHPLLKIAPEPGAGYHPHQVHGNNFLVLQVERDTPAGNALGKPLHHGGLPNSRIPDENRIVLGSAGEHLHQALHHIVPADDRVKLSFFRFPGHVRAVLLQVGLALFFLLLGVDRLLLGGVLLFPNGELLFHLLRIDAQRPEKLHSRTLPCGQDARQDILRPRLLVTPGLCRGLGLAQDLVRLAGDLDSPGLDTRGAPVISSYVLLHQLVIQAVLLQQAGRSSSFFGESPEKMLTAQVTVPHPGREFERVLKNLQSALTVHLQINLHESTPPSPWWQCRPAGGRPPRSSPSSPPPGDGL